MKIGYNFVCSIQLKNVNTWNYDEIGIYYSITEKKYTFYSGKKALTKLNISRYQWTTGLSDMITSETKRYIREERLNSLLNNGN